MQQRKRIQANGSKFTVTDSGSEKDPAVLLLHGFPNSASLWNKQIKPLTEAGFRVVAPDLRGAVGGESEAPLDVEAYSIPDVLVKDVAGIMDALNIKQARIVGHDWGAALAWAFAALFPDRTLQLVAISVGHPSAFFTGDHIGKQRQCSWYVLMFIIPGIGEQLLLSGTMGQGLLSPEAQAVEGLMAQELGLVEALQKPGAATAALNYYRANVKPEGFIGGSLVELPPVQCNVLQIWPTGDHIFCTEGQAKTSGNHVKSPGAFQYVKLETPSHFAPYTDPEPISAEILKFLQK